MRLTGEGKMRFNIRLFEGDGLSALIFCARRSGNFGGKGFGLARFLHP